MSKITLEEAGRETTKIIDKMIGVETIIDVIIKNLTKKAEKRKIKVLRKEKK